jgi:hypothetical protein
VLYEEGATKHQAKATAADTKYNAEAEASIPFQKLNQHFPMFPRGDIFSCVSWTKVSESTWTVAYSRVVSEWKEKMLNHSELNCRTIGGKSVSTDIAIEKHEDTKTYWTWLNCRHHRQLPESEIVEWRESSVQGEEQSTQDEDLLWAEQDLKQSRPDEIKSTQSPIPDNDWRD